MITKPILFNADMIKAILSGQKTQTRRIVKLPPWSTGDWGDFELDDLGTALAICEKTTCWVEVKSPYGGAGDHLWVREKHTIECPYGPPNECDNPDHVIYWAAESEIVRDSITAKWRPSIFMPRWASRITLRVKSGRVERLQDIIETDAIAEGVEQVSDGLFRCYQNPEKGCRTSATASFMSLWDSINEKRGYGWDTNPWVWVTEFDGAAGERVE